MLRNTFCLAIVSGMFMSTATYAEQHDILVLPTAYFPQTTYVHAGDTLTFVNNSDEIITVVSADGAWTTGELSFEESATITVVANMTKDFFHEGVSDENGNPAVTGILEFGNAPTN